MALDSWLGRVKSVLSTKSSKTPISVGILAFEVAGVMSKLLHLWRSLSDHQLLQLHDSITLPGVRKIVSDDDFFLLSLACAEFTDSVRVIAKGITVFSGRCIDSNLRDFGRYFDEFVEHDRDEQRWVMGCKEMENKVKRMERYVALTTKLYKEMEEVVQMEQCLKRVLHNSTKTTTKMAAMHQKITKKKQEMRHLKEVSLWDERFDIIVLVLARSVFTILSRIKQVFGINGKECSPSPSPPPPPPRLSFTAAVYPSMDTPPKSFHEKYFKSAQQNSIGFLESSSAALLPPPTTLGSAALALRYANIIVVLEKMIRQPRLIGPDAREDLYSMLPAKLRSMLRSRLRLVSGCAATDVGLAEEWKEALNQIVEWLGPLAHNTLRWLSERSFERRATAGQRSGVLLLQTLHFAVAEKAEAAVVELLVGLNYIWRFEMEKYAKAVLLYSSSSPLSPAAAKPE